MSDMEEDAVYCIICGQAEDKPSRVIECHNCKRSVHLKCKKIYGNAVAKVRKEMFFCSNECAEMYSSIHRKHECGANQTLINEIKAIGDAVLGLQSESQANRNSFNKAAARINELVETTKHIETSQSFISAKFDGFEKSVKEFTKELCNIRAENATIRNELEQWQIKHLELASTVDKLEADLDRVNREAISNNAVIMGIPPVTNENLVEVVTKFGKAVGYELQANSVVSTRRLRTKNPGFAAPILVTFASNHIKEQVFSSKLAYGTLAVSAFYEEYVNCSKPITIRDEMTPYGREMLSRAKELQSDLDIKFVWPGRDGKVLFRRTEGAKVEQISCKNQLASLTKTVYKRSLNASSTSAGSSPNEPNAKRQNHH